MILLVPLILQIKTLHITSSFLSTQFQTHQQVQPRSILLSLYTFLMAFPLGSPFAQSKTLQHIPEPQDCAGFRVIMGKKIHIGAALMEFTFLFLFLNIIIFVLIS